MMSPRPDAELEKKVIGLVSEGRKIDAIRAYHEASGESLNRSAEVVGKLEEELKTTPPDKLAEYWKVSNKPKQMFLNFELENNNLKVGDQVFDLHGTFQLRGYSYDTLKRIFVLSFYRDAYDGYDWVQTNVQLIFRNVSFLRVHDKPMDAEVHFNSMKIASNMFMKPEIALQVEQELIELQVDEELAASADEGREADTNYIENITADIDWSQYLYIDFIWGAEILICAESVEATLQQSSEIDK